MASVTGRSHRIGRGTISEWFSGMMVWILIMWTGLSVAFALTVGKIIASVD